jgi:glycosyltransferase involved in cell wall biosynthesis
MRILWLKTELLHPVDKGGRIRSYHTLKELKRDHHIAYLTLDDGTSAPDAASRANEYCHELFVIRHLTRPKFTLGFYLDLFRNIFSRYPYFIMKYQSVEMRARIERLIRDGAFDVLVCDFLMPSVNLPPVVPCATVLFQHNVEAVIWRRHSEINKNPLKRLYLYRQWRKTFTFERSMCRQFDQVISVSESDSETLRHDYGVPEVPHVPTGVDVEYFSPSRASVSPPDNLVFTGSMDWLPNHDGICFFIREIMPLVRPEVPNLSLTIVGRNPYPELLELSRSQPGITVTGRVEDVRPYMQRAAAYIVPLRIGGGTRIKIFEAMAMEIPTVSTTVGAEGLPVTNDREILLADAPEDFARAIVSLLRDKTLSKRLALRAAALVRTEFGWNKSARLFAGICERAVQSASSAVVDRA